ncbi:MAG: amino acid ABC transporter ATP-binding protein [Acholeplasmatales bacterium]|nr:MAG: amino acid ABC transporter ATP-binding protein [Acholeplasmatales bacterium]
MKIEVDRLSHVYDVKVLKAISLKLETYRSVAIIGVSGSGKSTLLRILSGLEKPTAGTVSVNGKDVRTKAHRESVGFVFQSHNLFPHLTLERNITLILEKTRHMPLEKAIGIARGNLEALQLSDQMHKLPKHVSGGQAQRASIARALSLNPDVIFLDEPTASLDPILTHEVLMAVKKLRTMGKDFVFVTHVISFVRDFADYVIFMHEGEIIEQGGPAILDRPQTPEMRDYMEKVH